MAQQLLTSSGALIIPGAKAEWTVARQVAGLATTGVVAIVGESELGPAYNEETDLEADGAFGPDQAAAVVAKYGSGPLVDAFKAASSPSNDPNITGAPAKIILAKVNKGTKSSLALSLVGGGTYGTLYARRAGKKGDLLYSTTDQTVAEVIPTTGSFTWIPPVGAVTSALRLNGGAALPPTLGANVTPTAATSAFDGLAGVAATGGAARTTIQNSVGTLAVAKSGNIITVTYASGTFTTTPSVGDTLVIPNGSVIEDNSINGGADTDDNVGAYVVTAATSTSITATKLSDAGKPGANAGTVTAPVNVTPAIAVSATAANDLVVYAPVTITLEAGNALDGLGKSLEIAEQAGADLLSRCCYQLSTTVVTWVSKTGAAKLLTSSTERQVTLNLARQSDSIDESIKAGGDVAFTLGYLGTTAALTVTATALTTTVAGGSGGNLSLTLANFDTIADLATYINAQTGYSAAVGTTTLGQQAPTTLDRVTTAGICSTWGAKVGRVKMDAYKFHKFIAEQSSAVQLGDPSARAAAGIPATAATTAFFSGGLKGASINSDWTGAIDALEKVQCNFVVTAVSRDAIGADVTDGLTDSASTYTIDSINAYVRTHCLAMSKLKRRRNRQGFVSKRGTFQAARDAASNLASMRMAMCFQDFKTVNSAGDLTQFHPWMGAAKAAGMQAAGFYRAMVRKFADVSGAVQAAGDYDDRVDSQVEDALQSGLLPLGRHPNGGWYWVSDQTTYSKDNNFVYNSIQAVYAADIIVLGTALRMEDAFIGQSLADVSASTALTFLESIFTDYRRRKLIAPSDDAPRGFKNARVTISGPAMVVDAEIKLAGALYFTHIRFMVSQVEQTAT